jgi:tetratricopeptide (TPR) repeat protein
MLLVLCVVCGHARADDQPPWAKGVSNEQQASANTLFSEGNQLFAQLAHAPALDKYKAAIALWDHPMIRFNMAVTLIRLDRVLEAADELEKALRFDATPFTPELYQQALDYRALLKNQLGYLEVACDQPETHVQLDGKPWFDCPATRKLRVMSGEHAVVAERKGYLTVSRRVVVTGSATATERLELVPIESAVKLEYRHPKWLPWTTTGGGGAIALAGLGLWLAGKSQMDRFAQEFVKVCPTGCEADLAMHAELAAEEDGARLKGKLGISMMIAGGAIAAAGVTWGLWNRPIRRLPKIEVAPTGSGVSARVGWRF